MTLPTATPGNASVVSVRPTSPCDTSDYSIIVDERGRFLGNASPGSQVAASVEPGIHVFYSWGDRDLRFEGFEYFPGSNPVAAVRVRATAGTPSYVALLVRGTISRCSRYAWVDMVSVGPRRPLWNDLQGWLSSTTPLVADRARGQALLDTNPSLLRSNLKLGRVKLAFLDEERRDSERPNSDR